MSEQANESGENVSATQTLIARAQDLGRSIDNWNTAYMILVGFTVVLAAGVFIAQFVVIKKSKQLASVQDQLMAEKDAQSIRDSQDKELKISQLNETAEKERLARRELEEMLASRRLTKEQQNEIGSRLARFSDQVATMWCNAGDSEADTFALEVASALFKAKWKAFTPASLQTWRESGIPFLGSASAPANWSKRLRSAQWNR